MRPWRSATTPEEKGIGVFVAQTSCSMMKRERSEMDFHPALMDSLFSRRRLRPKNGTAGHKRGSPLHPPAPFFFRPPHSLHQSCPLLQLLTSLSTLIALRSMKHLSEVLCQSSPFMQLRFSFGRVTSRSAVAWVHLPANLAEHDHHTHLNH